MARTTTARPWRLRHNTDRADIFRSDEPQAGQPLAIIERGHGQRRRSRRRTLGIRLVETEMILSRHTVVPSRA